jgi:CheY-like chemotaxis protein
VTAVRSAEEALAQLAIMPPDALVTDVSMPGMPGVELVRRMRALGHVFPALVVSGYAEELTYERALSDQPGVAFLAKPFTRERFLRVLGALLARARDVGP